MRVIGGEARGRPLIGPKSTRTRPTSDKVKGALFSMLETLIASARPGNNASNGSIEVGSEEIWRGLTLLDLYAGTGALGIEALSRGASWCDFVDADAAARRVIERNLHQTGLAARGRVVGGEVLKLLQGAALAVLQAPYALVFLDPPYADRDIDQTIERLATTALLQPDALVAVEHSRRLPLAAEYASDEARRAGRALVEARQRRHGDTVLSIYRWAPPGDRGEDSDGHHGDLPGQL